MFCLNCLAIDEEEREQHREASVLHRHLVQGDRYLCDPLFVPEHVVHGLRHHLEGVAPQLEEDEMLSFIPIAQTFTSVCV